MQEAELVQRFLKFLSNSGVPNNTFITTEFESGHGIADLVLYSFNEIPKKNYECFSRIPPRYAILFKNESLPRIFSAQQFSNHTGTQINASLRLLNRLSRNNVLRHVSSEIYEQICECVNPIGSIISIEAKLRDWRRALRQAYRYREFSNQSWVLMDNSRISSTIEQIELFRRSGVGLASFRTSGELYIHYEPPVSTPFSESRYWAESNRLVSQHYRDL